MFKPFHSNLIDPIRDLQSKRSFACTSDTSSDSSNSSWPYEFAQNLGMLIPNSSVRMVREVISFTVAALKSSTYGLNHLNLPSNTTNTKLVKPRFLIGESCQKNVGSYESFMVKRFTSFHHVKPFESSFLIIPITPSPSSLLRLGTTACTFWTILLLVAGMLVGAVEVGHFTTHKMVVHHQNLGLTYSNCI